MKDKRRNHPCMPRASVAPVAPTATDITETREWIITDEDAAFALHIFSQDKK
jgi:hypothetical protein